MKNLMSSQPTVLPMMIKLITTVLLLISSQTPQTTCLGIDLGLGGLLPPISAPTLIPDLLNFLDLKLALVFPVIQAFKNTITLDPLGITKTWIGSDICSYAGFYCSATPENSSATAVASVDFNGFGLSAPTLDAFLSGLPDLAVFHANSNQFSGTISPAAAKALTYLYELDISNNGFLGPFPGAAFAAAASHSLTFLDARFNRFSGTVPPELFRVKTLDFLFLNNNAFVSTIPDALGSSRARYVTLANNKLTGPIPQSIGGAAATLTELLLRGNSLSGCLPYELGLLRKAVLFDAENNLLTGQIPRSFQCMSSLEVLNLAGNHLYGALPEAICGLGNLANLSLAGNYFTWVGPACRKLIGLGILDVKGNCVKGLPEQRPESECSLFFAVPRSCTNANSFNLVPCSDKVPNRSPPTRPRPQRKLVSYAALSRRRLTMEF